MDRNDRAHVSIKRRQTHVPSSKLCRNNCLRKGYSLNAPDYHTLSFSWFSTSFPSFAESSRKLQRCPLDEVHGTERREEWYWKQQFSVYLKDPSREFDSSEWARFSLRLSIGPKDGVRARQQKTKRNVPVETWSSKSTWKWDVKKPTHLTSYPDLTLFYTLGTRLPHTVRQE